MARLRVEFRQIEHRWLQTFFWVEAEEHEMWFSHVVYGDALARLCEALRLICEADDERTVTWMDEPGTYDMKFSRRGADFQLELWFFESYQRDLNSKSTMEFEISGSGAEICAPFWRALRDLGRKYDDADFAQRWGEAFPAREFNELTRALKTRGWT